MRNLSFSLLAFVALLALAGCGQRGPLYLPADSDETAAIAPLRGIA